MAILTLYVLNDWVLVTFVLIVCAALIWSSKQYLPVFFEQSKIVLNLGSVREGERVIYNGLPWKIESLGYYCKLENPDLSGASLRVNTKELINAHSRRSEVLEPWFPTKKGDWVQVNDQYGKVFLQSPEQVIIQNIAGEKIYYAAKDFYQLSPRNFSHGYAIEFVFGLDYELQATILSEVEKIFKAEVMQGFIALRPDLRHKISDLEVDFCEANSSSLDLRFFMRCDGSLASERFSIERKLKSLCIEVCNQHKYVIPFDQLTMHMEQERLS